MIEATTAMIRRYRHVNWALSDQAMVSGVNFITGILLARYLGLEEFGRFTLAWMAVLFVNNFQHAAIISPMMSIGPKQPDSEAPTYYGAIFIQSIIFSCATCLLLFAGVLLSDMLFPEWQVRGLALPLSIAAFAFQFQDFMRRYFFTVERQGVAFGSDAIRYLGQIAILINLFIFLREPMDASKIFWVIAITSLTAAVFGFFFVERLEVNGATLRKTTDRHWESSKWLVGSALVKWFTGNMLFIFAGAMLGVAAVGALKAAQNLMGVLHILFMGLENIVPIRAAKYYHKEGKKALQNYLKRVTTMGLGATAAISIAAIIGSNFWIGLVFGQEYMGYGYLLQWYAFIYILLFLSMPLRSALRAFEQTKPIFWSRFWGACFSVVTAYPLISVYKLSGVMFGLLGIQLIIIATLYHSFIKELGSRA